MYIFGTNRSVMFRWMIFGVIISLGFWARPPKDANLALFDPVVYLVEPHVHGLGLLLAELLSCDAYPSGIVYLDGCGSLCPSHFREGGADGYFCLGVDEDSAVFLFNGSHHDIAHDFHMTSKMPLVVGIKSFVFLGSGGPLVRK